MPIEKIKLLAKKKPFKIKNSLSIRLFTHVIICSSALIIIITSLQLFFSYQQQVAKIDAVIDQVESTFVGPIALNLWCNKRKLRYQ